MNRLLSLNFHSLLEVFQSRFLHFNYLLNVLKSLLEVLDAIVLVGVLRSQYDELDLGNTLTVVVAGFPMTKAVWAYESVVVRKTLSQLSKAVCLLVSLLRHSSTWLDILATYFARPRKVFAVVSQVIREVSKRQTHWAAIVLTPNLVIMHVSEKEALRWFLEGVLVWLNFSPAFRTANDLLAKVQFQACQAEEGLTEPLLRAVFHFIKTLVWLDCILGAQVAQVRLNELEGVWLDHTI